MFEGILNPPFRSEIKATGQGECWSHTNDNWKFRQFGWRCTKKEGSYSSDCLIGNWNEQRYDRNTRMVMKPLPSQYSHFFDTSNKLDYANPNPKIRPDTLHVEEVIKLKSQNNNDIPSAFPRHQPEFDTPKHAESYKSYLTTSRSDYVDPRIRRTPIPVPLIP